MRTSLIIWPRYIVNFLHIISFTLYKPLQSIMKCSITIFRYRKIRRIKRRGHRENMTRTRRYPCTAVISLSHIFQYIILHSVWKLLNLNQLVLITLIQIIFHPLHASYSVSAPNIMRIIQRLNDEQIAISIFCNLISKQTNIRVPFIGLNTFCIRVRRISICNRV